MEPEIARRCTDCGAAARGGAFFCPQCGKALRKAGATAGDSDPAAGGPAAEAAGEGPPRVAPEPRRTASIIFPQGTEAGGTQHAPSPAPEPPAARRPSSEGRRRTAEIIALRPEDEEASRRRRRGVTAAAREAVEEKLTPRVEKLRHASNAMLEEASYDPSLRFVLVAVAAVLLSLLLLLLNYVLG
jgi:hypothetical protein